MICVIMSYLQYEPLDGFEGDVGTNERSALDLT